MYLIKIWKISFSMYTLYCTVKNVHTFLVVLAALWLIFLCNKSVLWVRNNLFQIRIRLRIFIVRDPDPTHGI